jgi:hypothetical protein
LSPRHLYTAASNTLSLWRRETLGAALQPGGDDVALALVADAHARTYFTRVLATAETSGGVRMGSGLVFLPDRVGAAAQAIPPLSDTPQLPRAMAALDQALEDIGQRHGDDTAAFVALQMEYPMRQALISEPPKRGAAIPRSTD